MNQHQFFMDVAKACARQSTCLRRRYGAVIIDPKTRHILSTGYNGQPSGKEHCTDKGWCLRDELNIPQGERYEICLNARRNERHLPIRTQFTWLPYVSLW